MSRLTHLPVISEPVVCHLFGVAAEDASGIDMSVVVAMSAQRSQVIISLATVDRLAIIRYVSEVVQFEKDLGAAVFATACALHGISPRWPGRDGGGRRLTLGSWVTR